MDSIPTEMTIQQRVLSHTGTLSYCLRLLAHLSPDTVLVPGYSDGHTSIARVTFAQVEAMLASCIEQLEADAQTWQQPTVETGRGGVMTGGSAAS